MSLSGSLRDFSIPDVFRLVSLSGKTGVLHLARGDAEGSVWFRDGTVFFAQSDRRKGLLGERLVSAGRVSATALAHVVDIQNEEPEGGRRIGEILVDEGIITAQVLEAFVQEQIQDTVFDLFLWDEGNFEFEILSAPPADQDIGLAVSIENIVMEGARRLAQWTDLRTSASSSGVVFRVGSVSGEDVVDISLKPSEWRIVTLADGTRTVRQVAEAAGVTEFDAARTLYGLFGAGLLQIVEEDEFTAFGAEPLMPNEPDPASLIFLESEVVLAADPVFESDPAFAPNPDASSEPVLECVAESAAEPASDTVFTPEWVPEIDPLMSRATTVPEGVRRGVWAGIGSEVAALTGAAGNRPRYGAPPTPGPRAQAPTEVRRMRRDMSFTRQELLQIHAGIKEL
jgi:hypothetical protein